MNRPRVEIGSELHNLEHDRFPITPHIVGTRGMNRGQRCAKEPNLFGPSVPVRRTALRAGRLFKQGFGLRSQRP